MIVCFHKWKSWESSTPIPKSPVRIDMLFEKCVKCGKVRTYTDIFMRKDFTVEKFNQLFKELK